MRTDDATFTSATLMGDLLGLANGSDADFVYRFRYTDAGCSTINVPIDALNVSQTVACFGQQDIVRDKTDPFSFHIAPRDTSGSNCTLYNAGTGVQVTLRTTTGDSISRTFTVSDTIIHSTAYSNVAVYLKSSGPTDVTNEFLSPKFIVSGPGNPLNFIAIQANSRGQPTSRTSLTANATTTWNDSGNFAALWDAALPGAGNTAALLTNSSLTAALNPLQTATAKAFKVTEGAFSTTVPIVITGDTDTFDVMPEMIWGAPVFISRNTTTGNVRIWLQAIDTNSGSASTIGKTLYNITPPMGVLGANYIPNPGKVVVRPFQQNNGMASYAVAYDHTLILGVLDGSDSNGIAHFSTPYTFSGTNVGNVLNIQKRGFGASLAVALFDSPSLKISAYEISPPTYSKPTVSSNSPVQKLAPTSTSELGGTALDFVQCGGGGDADQFVIGRNGSGYLATIPVGTGGGAWSLGTGLMSSATAPTAAYTRAACLVEGNGRKHFVVTNPTSGGGLFASFDGPTPTCGGMSNQELGETSPIGVMSNGNPDVIGTSINGIPTFVYIYAHISFGGIQTASPSTCTSNNQSWAGGTQMGTLQFSSTQRPTSVAYFSTGSNGSSQFPQLAVAGLNGQFFLFDLR